MTIALSASRSLQNGSIYLLSNSLGEKEGNNKKKKQLVYVSSFLPCYCVSKIEASNKDLVVKLFGHCLEISQESKRNSETQVHTLSRTWGVGLICKLHWVKEPQVDLTFNRYKNVPISIINKLRHFWSICYTSSIVPRHHLSRAAMHTGRGQAFICTLVQQVVTYFEPAKRS